MNPDVVVIGGGMVGASVAYGLAGKGARVLVLDGGDRDFRSATANAGLVWSQGKGLGMPAYQQLTRDAADAWPAFRAELEDLTGVDLEYEHRGGLVLCVGADEYEARRARLQRLHDQAGGGEPDWEMVERPALERLLPKVGLGPGVVGGSFGRRDGHVNPLQLLHALHKGLILRGGMLRGGAAVEALHLLPGGGFRLSVGGEQVSTPRVVIAAGLGSKALAGQVGLDLPIRPQRGQILVTERIAPLLPLPLHSVRQTRDGTIVIGVTQEETGFDAGTTAEAAARLSARALQLIPALGQVALVRQWAGLRIMTPDSFPIYAESPSQPGAFVAVCHSGVTLAPTHANDFAEAVAAGRLPAAFDPFRPGRFDVPQAA